MDRLPTFRNFVRAYWSNWFAIMSGGPSVPAAIAALYVSSDYARYALWMTVALSVVLSAYFVWKTEREARNTAENRIAELENEYPHSLQLAEVDLHDNRHLSEDDDRLLARELVFLTKWKNAIARPICYHVTKTAIDGVDLAVSDFPIVIGGHSETTFYLAPIPGAIPVSEKDRNISVLSLDVLYGHPDKPSRRLTMELRIESFSASGLTSFKYISQRDVPI